MLLAKVARQDVEQLEDGTYRIARGTASARTISITDPEARHGLKSSSQTITGFKTHVMGTIASQFATGIAVTDAGAADARPTPDLIAQRANVGLKPEELLGDCAYGTGANRRACRQAGVALRTKLPAPSHQCFTKRELVINLEKMEVTCPNGATTNAYTRVKDPAGSGELVERFAFPPAICRACPMREACSANTTKGRGRTIVFSHYEAEIQESQRYNATPEAKVTLKKRSAVERLLSHLVRMGMRHARFFGMHRVEYQALMTAAAYNLQRYVTLMAA